MRRMRLPVNGYVLSEGGRGEVLDSQTQQKPSIIAARRLAVHRLLYRCRWE